MNHVVLYFTSYSVLHILRVTYIHIPRRVSYSYITLRANMYFCAGDWPCVVVLGMWGFLVGWGVGGVGVGVRRAALGCTHAVSTYFIYIDG